MMKRWAEIYPEYGFEKHKGYGTAQHIKALEEHYPTPIHRRYFAPIKTMQFPRISKACFPWTVGRELGDLLFDLKRLSICYTKLPWR